MAAPTLDTLARFAATGLANSLVLGTVIAAAAWAFLRLSGKQESRTRFCVWFSALLLAAILPWIGASASKPASELGHSAGVGITVPAWWALAIFWLWAAGASLALLRVGFAFSQLLRLRWHARPLAPGAIHGQVGADVPSTSSGQALVRAAGVCLSDDVRIPTAVGLFKPLIVIPQWALEELSPSELNSVLIHELEHLRRWDDWTNLAQKILAAVFFFHPAVWWLDRKLALEREMACDEAVLAQTGDRHGYAACLVRVAEKSLLRRGLALAQSVVGRVGQTTQRVAEILRPNRRPVRSGRKPALCLLAASSLCGVLLLTQAPLVSFQSDLPTVAATTPSATATAPEVENRAVPKPHVVLARHTVIRSRQAVQRVTADAGGALQANATPVLLGGEAVESSASIELTSSRGFLVVVQSEQFSEFGPAFLTICVWHVDAPGWHPLIPEPRAPAKSI
jgi:beta-lactamase regulating signal transducer with metallopeptidase domain